MVFGKRRGQGQAFVACGADGLYRRLAVRESDLVFFYGTCRRGPEYRDEKQSQKEAKCFFSSIGYLLYCGQSFALRYYREFSEKVKKKRMGKTEERRASRRAVLLKQKKKNMGSECEQN